jgi:putative membrane protein
MKFTISPLFFSMMGFVLSMFLVFRLNTAYDRWWEGRKLWGKLVNDSRILSANISVLLGKTEGEDRHFFAASISNFAFALKGHLRDDIHFNELVEAFPGNIDGIKCVEHVPNRIVRQIFEKVETLFLKGVITSADKINIYNQLQAFYDVLGACERIKNTPIPFSHSTFIKNFILMYTMTLPFGLVESFGYMAIPAAVLISYAMVGIEIISEEVENPFGLDINDLPTEHLSFKIRKNVYEMLDIRCQLELEEEDTGDLQIYK